MSVRVTNHGAACCVIEADGVRILCDPWLFGCVYFGAWERSEYLADPLTTIGPVDFVYISHLHPDHFHPESIRAYLKAYPKAQLWISDYCRHLAKVMIREGFQPLVGNSKAISGMIAVIIPNHGYVSDINIDTALVVADADSAVVNMNDCPFDQKQVDRVNYLTVGKHVTALLPFAGAGPWPQCYTMSEIECATAAREKKNRFLDQFTKYRWALHADVAVPFSAGYQLCGPLAALNPYLGIAQSHEIPGATILPVVGVSKRPNEPFPGYEWEMDAVPDSALIEGYIQMAAQRAPKVQGEPLTIELDWGTGSTRVECTQIPAIKAHETLHLDPRLLLRLLDGRAHWNNLEISGCAKITRHGRHYDSRTFDFLIRFHALGVSPTQEKNLAITKELVYVR